jgi:hypothetical protein
MAFRLVNPLPQFFTVDGKVLAGGNLYFTDSGTSNPRPTYADPDLFAENTNPVILDASGRPNADIWMDGVYRVVLKDASGATIWTKDNVEGPADLPGMAGNAGYFLGTDGAIPIWLPVLQVPSVAGQSGKVLINDGEAPYWDNPASSGIPALIADKFLTNNGTVMSWADVPGATSSSNSIKIGSVLLQFGTGTVPLPSVSPYHNSSVSITFPTPYAACIGVIATPKTDHIAPLGTAPILTCASSTTGATVAYDINSQSSSSGWSVNKTVDFTWLSIGTV